MRERVKKLMKFESIFYQLDADASLAVSVLEGDLLLSYILLDVNPDGWKDVFDQYDYSKNGELNRVEFVAMCADVLWHVPQEVIDTALANIKIARKSNLHRNCMHRKRLAANLDSWARVVIPIVYLFCLIIEFTDTYNFDQQMYKGFCNAALLSSSKPNREPETGRLNWNWR